MDTCSRCGHVLGAGRFCTNCGQPVGAPEEEWRSGTAERPAVPTDAPRSTPQSAPASTPPPPAPVIPPPAGPPSGARYPLFADEVHDGPATAPAAPTQPGPAVGGHSAPHQHSHQHQHRQHTAWLPWAVGFAAMFLVAGLGAWLLLSGNDDEPTTSAQATDPASSRTERSPSSSPTPSEASTGDTSSSKPRPGRAEDVGRTATATVPATAPPNEDTSGNLVRYEARNMLDGVATTCWRMPGDGTGETVTFDLAEPTTITEVGLVNGYAKTATDATGRPLDWYHGNRRVLSVEWVFDDGTTVQQTLGDTRDLQSVEVDGVTTSSVQVRLVSVSAPGTGRAARDYTAISDVALVGRTR